MADMQEQGPGLPARVLFAWSDLRASIRWLVARNPSEGFLLVIALASGVFFFMAEMVRLWADPATAVMPEEELLTRASYGFMSAMVFRTLALYAVAAIAWLWARAAGGTGSAIETRAAWFWAALVAGPVGLAAALLEIALGTALPPTVTAGVGQIGVAAYALAAAAMTAEVHGFKRAWTVLAAIAAAVLGLAALPALFAG